MSAMLAKPAAQAVAASATAARPAARRMGAARLPAGPMRHAVVTRVVGRNETAEEVSLSFIFTAFSPFCFVLSATPCIWALCLDIIHIPGF